MTISGHFFSNCINIIHKTEVQTVTLKCLMGLNLIWCKSYNTKHKMQKTHTSTNSPKFESDKWPFYDRFWPFLCQLYEHLSKNWDSDSHFEVLYNWYKSYDTKSKNAKEFFYKNCKKPKMEILVFSITFEPIEIWTC